MISNQKRFLDKPLSIEGFFEKQYLTNLMLSDDENQQQRAENFIRQHKYEKSFQDVLCVTIGLLNSAANDNDERRAKNGIAALNQFFDVFFDKPRDLIDDYEAIFLMRCLQEGQLLEKLDEKYQTIVWEAVLNSIERALYSDSYSTNSKNVVGMLGQCPVLIQSQRIEELLSDVLKDLRENTINLLVHILPHCRLEFLQSSLFPQLFTKIKDCPTETGSILELLNQPHAKLSQNNITNLMQFLPDLLVHENRYVRTKIAELILNHCDKVSTKVVARVLQETLPDLLKSANEFTRKNIVALIDKCWGKVSEVAAEVWQETLLGLLAHKDWDVQNQAATLILYHWDKAPTDVVSTVWQETVPGLLAHEDENARYKVAELILKHSDKAPAELVATVWQKTLLGLWAHHIYDIVKLIDKYLDKAPVELGVSVLQAILPGLLVHEDVNVRYQAVELIFNHWDKAPQTDVTMGLQETLLDWLAHENGYRYRRIEAAALFDKHFDKILELEKFIVGISNCLRKNDEKAAHIVEALFKSLSLVQLMKLSCLLQFSINCWRAVFIKAKIEHVTIFYTETEGKFYLHYGQQSIDKLCVEREIIENLRKYQDELIHCQLQFNDVGYSSSSNSSSQLSDSRDEAQEKQPLIDTCRASKEYLRTCYGVMFPPLKNQGRGSGSNAPRDDHRCCIL